MRIQQEATKKQVELSQRGFSLTLSEHETQTALEPLQTERPQMWIPLSDPLQVLLLTHPHQRGFRKGEHSYFLLPCAMEESTQAIFYSTSKSSLVTKAEVDAPAVGTIPDRCGSDAFAEEQ